METKKLLHIILAFPKEKKEEILDILQEKNFLHLNKVDFKKLDNLKIDNKTEIEKYYLDFSTVINWFSKNKKENLEEIYKHVYPIEEKNVLNTVYEKIKEIIKLIRKTEKIKNKEIPELEKTYLITKILMDFGIKNLNELKNKKFFIYLLILDENQYKIFKEKERKMQKYILKKYEKRINSKQVVLIISSKKIDCQFNSFLEEFLLKIDDLTRNFNKKLDDLAQIEKLLKNELNKKREELKLLNEKANKLFNKYKILILQVYKYLKKQIEKIDESEKIKESSYFIIIDAYVPKEKIEELEESLKNYDYLIEKKEVSIKEEAPTLIENKTFSYSEKLVEDYGIIRYGWFDLTKIFLISFTLFYGFIIADIAYGIILLLISLYMLKKTKKEKFKELGKLIMFLSFSTIFFGFIFGSFLGFKIFEGLLDPLEKDNLLVLIELSITLGAIYLILGALISIIYGIRISDKERVLENIAFLILVFSLLMFFIFKNPIFFTFILITALILLYLRGLLGLLDISSFIGNILSFARLGALTISGAFLSFLINKLFYSIIEISYFLFPLAVVIFLLLHSLNFILTVIAATVHSLRLNYLEFFSRAFKEGKEKFKPFGRFYRNL